MEHFRILVVFLILSGFCRAYETCGGHFYTKAGVLRSPNYPRQYPSNTVCEWIVEGAYGHQVELNVIEFALEYNCGYDYLEIRNGNSSTSPLLGKYCGTNIPATITSFGNLIYLKFHTDSSLNYKGFNIEWNSTTIGCNSTLTYDHGNIFSPNYPMAYSDNTECNWKIQVSPDNVVVLAILDLSLEPDSLCRWDYIEIYDGHDTSANRLGRYCDSNYPLQIDTISNVATVRFHSDNSVSNRGFHINYQTRNRTTWNTTERPSTTTEPSSEEFSDEVTYASESEATTRESTWKATTERPEPEATTWEPAWDVTTEASQTEKPWKITADHRVVYGNVNESAVLSCRVQGNQPANFTWVHHGQELDGEDSKYSTSISYHNETYVIMTLRFLIITPDDGGFFGCLARYPGGLISDLMYLELNNPPPGYDSENSSMHATIQNSSLPTLGHPGIM